MIDKHLILGIHVTDRIKHAERVQQLFTEYGCSIKTRIGLHDVRGDFCSPSGVILLELAGAESEYHEFARKLSEIEGVEIQEMVFDHPWKNED